jgi:hypothetical protein
MQAIPPAINNETAPSESQVSGLVCPDCPGVLTVEPQGHKGHLHFTGRIGHAFALPEVLLAKEQAIEERLWATVLALEEMAALLRDLGDQVERECGEDVAQAGRQRQPTIEALSQHVRRLIEADRPLNLHRDDRGSPEPARPGSPP